MEKALLIQFLEKLQENIMDAKSEIMPYLKKRAVKKLSKMDLATCSYNFISCFTELNTAEADIKDLLNLLKND